MIRITPESFAQWYPKLYAPMKKAKLGKHICEVHIDETQIAVFIEEGAYRKVVELAALIGCKYVLKTDVIVVWFERNDACGLSITKPATVW